MLVIEWNKRFPRELLLCDENGIALQVEQPGIQAPAFELDADGLQRGHRLSVVRRRAGVAELFLAEAA